MDNINENENKNLQNNFQSLKVHSNLNNNFQNFSQANQEKNEILKFDKEEIEKEKKDKITIYIREKANEINKKYNNIVDDNKINKAIQIIMNQFQGRNADFDKEIKPSIDALINNYLDEYFRQFKNSQANILMSNLNQNNNLQSNDLATIKGIKNKNELKKFIEKICMMFRGLKFEDIVPNFDSIETSEQLESAKNNLYQQYQNGFNYKKNIMSEQEKMKLKLKSMGVNEVDINNYLSLVTSGKSTDAEQYLAQKYGSEIATRFKDYMNNNALQQINQQTNNFQKTQMDSQTINTQNKSQMITQQNQNGSIKNTLDQTKQDISNTKIIQVKINSKIFFDQRSPKEIEIAKGIRQKNNNIKLSKTQKFTAEKPKIKTLNIKSNKGGGNPENKGFAYSNMLLLILSYIAGALSMAIIFILGGK